MAVTKQEVHGRDPSLLRSCDVDAARGKTARARFAGQESAVQRSNVGKSSVLYTLPDRYPLLVWSRHC